jgi:hypothetical protein
VRQGPAALTPGKRAKRQLGNYAGQLTAAHLIHLSMNYAPGARKDWPPVPAGANPRRPAAYVAMTTGDFIADMGVAGPSAVSSDEFELRLGLLRTAQNEWERIDGSPGQAAARQALLAYAQGVNDDITQVRASGDWPALFTLTGAYPAPWTPVDSLVVQGDLTEELDYTTEPLDYAILERSLGAANAMKWFPVLPANTGTPGLHPVQGGPGGMARAHATARAIAAFAGLPPYAAVIIVVTLLLAAAQALAGAWLARAVR